MQNSDATTWPNRRTQHDYALAGAPIRTKKLCGRCQNVMRQRYLLHRVNFREEQKVDCALCGNYGSGGEFEMVEKE